MRRFRMYKHVCKHLREGVSEYDDYFRLKKDCTCLPCFSSTQKRTIAIWKLSSGVVDNVVDEYLRMSKSTYLEFM